MQIISHRGYWLEPVEKNSRTAFERTLAKIGGIVWLAIGTVVPEPETASEPYGTRKNARIRGSPSEKFG